MNITKANAMLKHQLQRVGKGIESTRLANIKMLAQSYAIRAYRNGERYRAGNNTTYPRKHYAALEKVMGGAMSAKELSAFDDAYDAYMAWEGNKDMSENMLSALGEGVVDLMESANLEVALRSFEGNLDDVVTIAVVLKGIAKSALRRKQLNVSELQSALKRMSKMLNGAQTDVRNIVRAMSEECDIDTDLSSDLDESELASELRDTISESFVNSGLRLTHRLKVAKDKYNLGIAGGGGIVAFSKQMASKDSKSRASGKPSRHYAELKRFFGSDNKDARDFFDEAYNAHMEWFAAQ